MTCSRCGTELSIGAWPFCPHGLPHGNLSPLGAHDSESIMVWEHPGTGEIRYPDRNDRVMPKRYQEQGYTSRRLKTLREADRFCESRGVVNHKLHYDSNGKSYDGA